MLCCLIDSVIRGGGGLIDDKLRPHVPPGPSSCIEGSERFEVSGLSGMQLQGSSILNLSGIATALASCHHASSQPDESWGTWTNEILSIQSEYIIAGFVEHIAVGAPNVVFMGLPCARFFHLQPSKGCSRAPASLNSDTNPPDVLSLW